MNRNVESHFSTVPTMKHQRSTFDRSFSNATTFDFGEVIPIGFCEEVLPGDTWQVRTSKLVRLQTLLAPVFGNMYLDTYFFFVPNRIVWTHWKEFMGENTSGAWIPSVEYTVPRISAPSGGFKVGTIADYMGFPVLTNWNANDKHAPSALWFRAYAAICDQFFKDENLNLPNVVTLTDSNVAGSNAYGISDFEKGGMPYKAAKYHDYFSSCLPSPQRGPSVNMAAAWTGGIPVTTGPYHPAAIFTLPDVGQRYVPMTWSSPVGVPPTPVQNPGGGLTVTSSDTNVHTAGVVDATVGSLKYSYYADASTPAFSPTNLWAWPQLANSNITFTVNDLRLAVVTQMYYESLARSGSRYEEQLEQFFGVRNPDSRMNHPEYLGGNRIRINVHEITNTAQGEQDFLGDVGAKSQTADSHFDFVKSFTEHGMLIGLCVARYEHSFHQGMPQKFTRTKMFDFYNPLFANIGEQPVYASEIYASGNMNSDTVFGYQEAWASYRYAPNLLTGYMRPNVPSSFSHWSIGDNYASSPTLSGSWIKEDKTNVDRCLAVTSSVANQLFGDFFFDVKVTRPMPMYSVPGTIGAF